MTARRRYDGRRRRAARRVSCIHSTRAHRQQLPAQSTLLLHVRFRHCCLSSHINTAPGRNRSDRTRGGFCGRRSKRRCRHIARSALHDTANNGIKARLSYQKKNIAGILLPKQDLDEALSEASLRPELLQSTRLLRALLLERCNDRFRGCSRDTAKRHCSSGSTRYRNGRACPRFCCRLAVRSRRGAAAATCRCGRGRHARAGGRCTTGGGGRQAITRILAAWPRSAVSAGASDLCKVHETRRQ